MAGAVDKSIWLSVVVPTLSRDLYLRRYGARWAFLKNRWPYFEVLVVEEGVSPMGNRHLGLQRAVGEVVVFVDDDCEISLNMLKRMAGKAPHLAPNTLLAGKYISPVHLTIQGRTYNELCNEWLQSCTERFLGGAFALRNSGFARSFDFSQITEVGGEEEAFAQSWIKKEGKIELDPQFEVIHLSQKPSKDFWLRAVRHGKNWNGNQPLGPQKFSLLLRWGRASKLEKPWLALHASGLLAGRGLGYLGQLFAKSPRRSQQHMSIE